jgi:HSP20 family protein
MERRQRTGGYLPLREAMEQLFEGSFITPQAFAARGAFPPVDVFITEDDLVLEMAVPGANPDDINISVTGDTVTLSGEIRDSRQQQKGQAYLDEIWRGRFQRSFTLPIQVDADKAEATFENGILVLRLPKSEATKPRKIQVKGGQQTIQGESTGSDVQTESVPVSSSPSS